MSKPRRVTRKARAPILPRRGDPPLPPDEAAPIVAAFVEVRDRHRGSLVAPASALPAPPDVVARSIASLKGEDPASARALDELLVDLQAFVDDDYLTGPMLSDAVRAMVLERQAGATLRLGHGETEGRVGSALGAAVPIGEAGKAFDRVHAHGAGELGAMFALLFWPVGLLLGVVVSIVIGWHTLWSVIAAAVLLVLGYGKSLGPWVGWQVAVLVSAIDRRPLRVFLAAVSSDAFDYLVGAGIVVVAAIMVLVGGAALGALIG